MFGAILDGEARVRAYLSSFNLRAERFTKTELRRGKTPDFRAFSGNELAFYCEVKTAQRDEWLDRQLAAAPPGTLVGGLRPDPVYSRISNRISEAVRQFDAVNPSVDYPNVIAIVNGDDGSGFADLIQVLTGNAYCESGEVITMFWPHSDGRIREARFRVHLYLWFNEWRDGGPRMYFPEVHTVHHGALCRLLRVNPAELTRLPNPGNQSTTAC